MPTKRKILLLPCSSGETAVQRPSTNCFLIKHFQNKIPTSRNTTLLKSCVFFQEIIKCQSCMSKHLQMLAVLTNILLQWWVFLLLLKAVKNKLRAKKPREFERARYLWQRQQLPRSLSILRCWGGRKAFTKKKTPKSTILPTKLVLVEDVQHKTCGCTEGWHSGWPAQLCTGVMCDCTAITPPQRVAQTHGKAWRWGTNLNDASLASSRLTGTLFGFQTFAYASIAQTFHLRGGVIISICDHRAETQHLWFKYYLAHINAMEVSDLMPLLHFRVWPYQKIIYSHTVGHIIYNSCTVHKLITLLIAQTTKQSSLKGICRNSFISMSVP